MDKPFSLFLIVLIVIGALGSTSALSITTHVPEKYTDVVAGERFYFEISVKYPENPRRKDLRLEYEILDLNGKLIAQSKALKAIETQASFIDFIVIPESANSGIHIINIKVTDYESLSEEVSSSFHITKPVDENAIIYILISIAAIIIIGFFIIISILRKKRS